MGEETEAAIVKIAFANLYYSKKTLYIYVCVCLCVCININYANIYLHMRGS